MTLEAGRLPKLRDVARHAGVSMGTVSHVLNHPDKVSELTRARVRASIEALGFVRDANASSLAAGGSRSIGLVVIDLNNSMFVDVAAGAQVVAASSGLNLLLAASQDDFERQRQNVEFFLEARVAGLLLAPMQDSTAHRDTFLSRGRPVVLVNYDPGSAEVCSVIVDNEQVGYLAGKHMIAQGCRKLMFVHGDLALQPVLHRLEGLRRAVRESASAVRVEEVSMPDLTVGSGRKVAERIAARGPGTRPEGIVAVTDTLASGIVTVLHERGIDVPGDIAVMGCDDNSSAPRAPRTLTTVAMSGVEMGRAAMRLMIEELNDDQRRHLHQRVVVEPVLVPGGSTRF